ncbi:MAG: TIGR02172 family protein [Fibrobacter sp.]|nr:TIGR02172 family protein [Fibrobacter sp.]
MMNEFEKINLDDYVQTGEGGTSTSYTHKTRNSVAKLYKPGTEADRAKEDFLTARIVFGLGVPTPEPYRLITDGERVGAEYELIKDKRSFSRIISEEPERMQELSVQFAKMAKELHALKADTSRLRSAKDIMRRFYTEKNIVPEFYKIKVLNYMEKIPDTTNCLHGDLQISNLITDGKRLLWIDVGDFCYGMPEWDLAWSYGMFSHIDEIRADKLFHLKQAELVAHWNIFFPAYLGTDDPQQIADATKRLLPFYAIKLPYMMDLAHYQPLPTQAFEHLAKFFE